DAQVEGLDVVEIAATGALAPGVAGKALELAATPAAVVPQLAVHEQLQAVKARVPVGELQFRAGEGRHVAGVEGANRVDVDVVGHVGGVGAQGELPGARAGPLPGQAGAEGVGHLGLQVDVPQVGIAVAEPAHHGHRHGAPAPGDRKSVV